jgi:glycerophosphoryl diester phosphodiesterase
VQLSNDGQIVVIHDFAVDATTDGHGPVGDKTLEELQALDAGSWFGAPFEGQRIPTLQEVIDVVGGRLLLNIELKTKSARDDGLVAAVVRAVEQNNLQDRVVLSSFNPLAVWRAKLLNADLPVGLLYAPDAPIFLRRPWLRYVVPLDALHPSHTIVDDAYLGWAKQRGFSVHTWTVDDPGEMQRLVDGGVDIIITNRPDVLRQVLQAGRRDPRQL